MVLGSPGPGAAARGRCSPASEQSAACELQPAAVLPKAWQKQAEMLKICVLMGFGVRVGLVLLAGFLRDQAWGGRALALPCPQGPVAFQAPEAVFF